MFGSFVSFSFISVVSGGFTKHELHVQMLNMIGLEGRLKEA